MKRLVFTIIFIFLISGAYANDNTPKIIDAIYKMYKQNKEMGGCMHARVNNDSSIHISSWYFGNYGNYSFVSWECPNRFGTEFHTHPYQYEGESCMFSDFDINEFKNSPGYYTSVVFCKNSYRVMWKKTTYIYSDIEIGNEILLNR